MFTTRWFRSRIFCESPTVLYFFPNLFPFSLFSTQQPGTFLKHTDLIMSVPTFPFIVLQIKTHVLYHNKRAHWALHVPTSVSPGSSHAILPTVLYILFSSPKTAQALSCIRDLESGVSYFLPQLTLNSFPQFSVQISFPPENLP